MKMVPIYGPRVRIIIRSSVVIFLGGNGDMVHRRGARGGDIISAPAVTSRTRSALLLSFYDHEVWFALRYATPMFYDLISSAPLDGGASRERRCTVV